MGITIIMDSLLWHDASSYIAAEDGPDIFNWIVGDPQDIYKEVTQQAREVAARHGIPEGVGGRFPAVVWEVVWPRL